MKRRIDIFILIALAAILVGCGDSQQKPWDTLENCKEENIELSLRAQALEAENEQLTEQVHTLSKLEPTIRLKALDTLEKIRIGKRTGFYDTDGKTTLVIRLEPVDSAQDTIKAVGKVDVELWDLNAKRNDAKLAEWVFEPADLHKTWGGSIFTGHYRLEIDADGILTGKQEELTVKVTFTDYLTGKVLKDQQVIDSKNYNWR